MDNINYINISRNVLDDNIKSLKNKFKYDYYILDVSNNAFGHGMFIMKNLEIDYLYTNSLKDVYNIRKYDKDIPVILNDKVNEDNILDAINNNIILIIQRVQDLKEINEFDLFDNINVILNIDVDNNYGIGNREEIKDAIDIITNNKRINLMGIKADISEDKYKEFIYLINPLLKFEIKLFILNNEINKYKYQYSNAIIFKTAIYGINNIRNRFFRKDEKDTNQIFNLYSRIVKIKNISKGKKNKYIAIIPFENNFGILNLINKVYIKNKLYSVLNIEDNYMIVEIDDSINEDSIVEITGINNPLENYVTHNILGCVILLNNNLPILYDNKEKQDIYS